MTGSPRRRWWHVLGMVLAGVLVIGGLAILGLIVLLWVGMANYGSNK